MNKTNQTCIKQQLEELENNGWFLYFTEDNLWEVSSTSNEFKVVGNDKYAVINQAFIQMQEFTAKF